ncbi:guanylate kinase [Syntrophus aciditrophicus]|uniref:Guanylate kinase n=1 Tax=Syntrophus aciditrophicus (strain SB) TaxID=56780 RepID=KGUA_SYNAS|nr:guanylate kinase [Syntrophus aciditrophicus]Q2LQ62.1 RecName: Full=Guanylate kinase; AltName: Full=GMP kinase [Syntrophus aciditrophicus SB]ABC76155.1 guanylate kinase [Syntrophus aciditrophicus SB]
MNKAGQEARGFFIVLSAASGTGKTSIRRIFLERCPEVQFSVSYTTRTARPGEVDGQDYFFVTETDFRERIDQGEFAEWEENYGRYYGTSGKVMTRVLEQGRDMILDIEPRGAKTLKKNYQGGIYVFVLPPSLAELKARLRKRGESEAEIRKRLDKVREEIAEARGYDYVIFNDSLEKAVERLQVIYQAEKSRASRMSKQIQGVLDSE